MNTEEIRQKLVGLTWNSFKFGRVIIEGVGEVQARFGSYLKRPALAVFVIYKDDLHVPWKGKFVVLTYVHLTGSGAVYLKARGGKDLNSTIGLNPFGPLPWSVNQVNQDNTGSCWFDVMIDIGPEDPVIVP